jgi:hypothetical protein
MPLSSVGDPLAFETGANYQTRRGLCSLPSRLRSNDCAALDLSRDLRVDRTKDPPYAMAVADGSVRKPRRSSSTVDVLAPRRGESAQKTANENRQRSLRNLPWTGSSIVTALCKPLASGNSGAAAGFSTHGQD